VKGLFGFLVSTVLPEGLSISKDLTECANKARKAQMREKTDFIMVAM
jgi:hypothetical protein